jgi:hypothetical protein
MLLTNECKQAKENDILWSGGMPDDTSVIVARVIGGTV